MNQFQSKGYNLIAPFYDDGIGLLFGRGIFDAQIHFLSKIPSNSKVLILGGGTGWLLVELLKRNSQVDICYIDSSEKMIGLARSKTTHFIEFICGTEKDIPPANSFDFIITNFYVDGFSYEVLKERIRFISTFLKPNAKWIVTDFVETGKKKHSRILWLVHLFFRILIKHPNKNLVDWQKVFKEEGLTMRDQEDFNNGFIRTVVYS